MFSGSIKPVCLRTTETITDVISGSTTTSERGCDYERNGPRDDSFLRVSIPTALMDEMRGEWIENSCGPDGKFWEVK
jgi:hypothetical protein